MNQDLQNILNEIVKKIEFKDNSKNSEPIISFEVADIENDENNEKNEDQSSLTHLIPFEDENSFDSDSKDQTKYEILWTKRKRELEIQADKNAKKIFKSWKKEKLSLKEIIDISLKDYIELYEHAQALRLQFEAEKNEWIEKARNLLDSYKEGSFSNFNSIENIQENEIEKDSQELIDYDDNIYRLRISKKYSNPSKELI